MSHISYLTKDASQFNSWKCFKVGHTHLFLMKLYICESCVWIEGGSH